MKLNLLKVRWLLVVFSTTTLLQVVGQDWKVSGSFNYDTGDYGTGTDTTSIYMPLTLTRYFERGDIGMTIPYIYQESSSLVTSVGGVPSKIRKQTTTTTLTTTSNDGIGDIIFRGHYYLFEESRKHPLDVSLLGKIKTPTADDTKGLGTGEFDETFGVELNKHLAEKWNVFTDLSYTFIGSPPGTPLNDQVTWDLGASYDIRPDLTGSLSYEYRTALTDDGTDPQTVYANLDYKLTKVVRIFGGLLLGLSDGSPDVGISLGSSIRF
jgi:hypothetical protein